LEQVVNAAYAFAVLDQVIQVVDVAQVLQIDAVVGQALQVFGADIVEELEELLVLWVLIFKHLVKCFSHFALF